MESPCQGSTEVQREGSAECKTIDRQEEHQHQIIDLPLWQLYQGMESHKLPAMAHDTSRWRLPTDHQAIVDLHSEPACEEEGQKMRKHDPP